MLIVHSCPAASLHASASTQLVASMTRSCERAKGHHHPCRDYVFSCSADALVLLLTQLVLLNVTCSHSVLVGNKCDMVKERQVSTEMGQKMAREWGDNVLFFETRYCAEWSMFAPCGHIVCADPHLFLCGYSAKDRTNIEETFQAVARKIQQEERSSGLGTD